MTPEEAADYLRIHTRTLSRLRKDKTHPLPYLKFGGERRYLREDLIAYGRRSAEEESSEGPP